MNRTIESPLVQPSGIDIVIKTVLSRWKLVFAASILFGIAMTVLAFIRTPIYRGVTILAAAEKKGTGSNLSSALGSVGGLASLVGMGLGAGDSATEEAVAVLKSPSFTEAFIRDNNLLPELFPESWDSKEGHWKNGKKIPTLGKGFHAFDGIRKIERDTKSGLITLRVDWKDPVTAANWTNQLTDRLNAEMRERALAEAEASMGYLRNELAATVDVATHEAISRLMENEIKQEMLAHVIKEYALKVVDKAIPADRDDPVRPVKVLYTAFGLFFGGMVGAALALWRGRRQPLQEK